MKATTDSALSPIERADRELDSRKEKKGFLDLRDFREVGWLINAHSFDPNQLTVSGFRGCAVSSS